MNDAFDGMVEDGPMFSFAWPHLFCNGERDSSLVTLMNEQEFMIMHSRDFRIFGTVFWVETLLRAIRIDLFCSMPFF